jgi:prevent-host-death family protein
MRYESISIVKNNLSAIIREVQQGETIVVTDRGRPVARLEPMGQIDQSDARLLALVEDGLASLPRKPADASVLDLPMPAVVAGPSAVDYLLEEREGGR